MVAPHARLPHFSPFSFLSFLSFLTCDAPLYRAPVMRPCAVPLWHDEQAFMGGKLKIKGNMGLAMKLGTVIDAARPKSKL